MEDTYICASLEKCLHLTEARPKRYLIQVVVDEVHGVQAGAFESQHLGQWIGMGALVDEHLVEDGADFAGFQKLELFGGVDGDAAVDGNEGRGTVWWIFVRALNAWTRSMKALN